MRAFLITLALVAVLPGLARADTIAFSADSTHLPSSAEPNLPGAVTVPFSLSIPPAAPENRSYEQLLELWQRAGDVYGVPWPVLAAINKIESNFGQSMGPSSAGAIGWMQFLPSSWEQWGVDANGDGLADPWNPDDAIFSAARYLAAFGAPEDLYGAIYAYNHADWYVLDVLELTQLFTGAGDLSLGPVLGLRSQAVFNIDLEQRLTDARAGVKRARRAVSTSERKLESLKQRRRAIETRAGNPSLSGKDFGRLERRAGRLEQTEREMRRRLEEASASLGAAKDRLREIREEAVSIAFVRPLGVFQPDLRSVAGSLFPVMGPSTFSDDFAAPRHSTGWHHGTDVFAAAGAPVLAVAGGELFQVGWNDVGGHRLWLRDDWGTEYYYAHLAGFSALAQEGARVETGDVLGFVGTTGDAEGTPPHLHFEIHPAELTGFGYDGVVNPYSYLLSWKVGAAGASALGSDARSLAFTTRARIFDVVRERVLAFTR